MKKLRILVLIALLVLGTVLSSVTAGEENLLYADVIDSDLSNISIPVQVLYDTGSSAEIPALFIRYMESIPRNSIYGGEVCPREIIDEAVTTFLTNPSIVWKASSQNINYYVVESYSADYYFKFQFAVDYGMLFFSVESTNEYAFAMQKDENGKIDESSLRFVLELSCPVADHVIVEASDVAQYYGLINVQVN